MGIIFLISCNSNQDKNSSNNDTQEIPMDENAAYIYNPHLEDSILVYTYTNPKWDLDGDKKVDSIQFVGNGGAHQYYYLRIKLSSKTKWNHFHSLSIDFPEPLDINLIDPENLSYESYRCDIFDFDNDGLNEIRIQLDDKTEMPDRSEKNGLHTKELWVDYENNQLNVKDYNSFRNTTNLLKSTTLK